jgi:hypothetical protein
VIKVEKVTGIFAENMKANEPVLRIACFCLIGNRIHGGQTAGYSDLLKFYFGWALLTTSYGFINTFGATWPLE